MDDVIGYSLNHPAVVAAREALALGRRGWESLRDECYAWRRVRDLLDPGATSNTGQKGIHWRIDKRYGARRQGAYDVRVHGAPCGTVHVILAAPANPEDARNPRNALLRNAIARRNETTAALVAEYGPLPVNTRGLYEHLRLVLAAAGLDPIPASKPQHIAEWIKAADAYAPEEWSPNSGRDAHLNLRKHPDRVTLLARGVSDDESRIIVRAHTRRIGTARPNPLRPVSNVPMALAKQLRLAYLNGYTLRHVVNCWKEIEGELGDSADAA